MKHLRPPAIILCDPKYPHNVGAVLRVCSCFQIPHLLWTGSRVTMDVTEGQRLPREERLRGYRDVELHPQERRPLDRFADCTPIAAITMTMIRPVVMISDWPKLRKARLWPVLIAASS